MTATIIMEYVSWVRQFRRTRTTNTKSMQFMSVNGFTRTLVIVYLLCAAVAWAQGVSGDNIDRQSTENNVVNLLHAGSVKSAMPANAALANAMQAREVARTRPVAINFLALQKVREALKTDMPQTIRIVFFDDAVLLVQITRTERFGSNGTAYVGTVPGVALSSVVIVEENGVVSGNVNVLGDKYEIRNFGEAGHVMRQIDATALPPDHIALPAAAAARAVPVVTKVRRPAEAAVNTAADDGSLIDVMVVYTPAARISQGGTAAMNSLINLGIAETNNAYSNSQVKQRLRLVYAGEVNYTEVDFSTDLARLQGVTDGFMDDVHRLRDLYGADLVSLWGNYSGACGLSNLMLDESASFASQGFSVVDRNCATSNFSFGHELGHNMGLQHDVFDGNSGTTVTPEGSTITVPINYAHGYVDLGNRFRSVMAISAQCDAQVPAINCPRIPNFSNPNVYYSSAPTGNTNAQEFKALNDTRETTANFRASVNLSGAGTVIFSPINYSVSEAAGSITLSAARHAGSTGAVSVNYATNVGTATAGTDFIAQSGTLNWANGEVGTKNMTIPILQDGMVDGPKTFNVTMDSPAGGVSIGAPGGTTATATVSINDADTDNFPPGCMLPLTGWTISASGWAVATDSFFGAACSLKSNPTADAGSARIQFAGNFVAGTISFARRVSSQSGKDCLRFYIDSVEQNIGGACGSGGLGASGDVPWGMVSFNISVGAHTLYWTYEKDGVGAAGEDAAWLDSVVLPLGGAPLIQSAPPPGGFLNIPYSHTIVARGSPTIGYALLSPTLPDGLTLNTVTGVISGIPITLGTFSGFVRAFNDAFPPFAQQPFSIAIVGIAPGAPVASGAIPDNGRARIIFSPPMNVGSAPVTSYTATCNPNAFTGTSATSPITVIGLGNGVEYSCDVTASNIYGTSGGSSPVLVMPLATKPDAPTIDSATPGDAQAFISFSPPVSDGGLPITSYVANCTPGALTGVANSSPVIVSNLLNRTLYSCSVTATNAIGLSSASATTAVIPSTTAALTLIGVASRKSHGIAGAFDLPVDTVPPIGGTVTVEPRSTGDGHNMVFKFNNAISTGVSATVVDTANSPVGALVNVSGTEVIVTMPSLVDAARVTISLRGVNGLPQLFSASVGFLVGDVSNSRSVSASDVSGVKARSGQTTNATNFKFDLNTSGSIDASDIMLVKARSGSILH